MHTSRIKALEYVEMGGTPYIFSGGDDKTVKAWSFDMPTGNLKLVEGRPFDYPITSLCFVKPL